MKGFFKSIILLLVFFVSPLWAVTLSTRVDQPTVLVGNSFQLIIDASDYHGNSSPNFNGLTQDFNLVGVQQSQEIEVINGQSSTRTEWVLMLIPKRPGQITIPSISLGNAKSQPVVVTVLPATSANANVGNAPAAQNNDSTPQQTTPGKGVMLETSVTPKDPYVQQQTIYTVKILYTMGLQNASLNDPTVDNAKVMRFGNDRYYQTRKNGRIYNVIERRYVIFPQNSGALIIQPGELLGNAINVVNSSQWSSLFDAGVRPIDLTADPTTINVKPAPTNDQNQWWLPAADLTIAQTWSQAPDTVTVGQPITRTITIIAQGLTGAQLPPLPQQTMSNVNVYPNKPQIIDKTQGQWVVGEQQTKIAYVPTQSGHITFPEIKISWWNTKTQQAEVATLPKTTMQVLPAATSTTQTPGTPVFAPQNKTTVNPLTQATSSTSSTTLPSATIPVWKRDIPWLLAGLFFIAWLVTMILFLKRRRVTPQISVNTQQGSANFYKDKIKAACFANQAHTVKDEILRWATHQFDIVKPQSLAAVADLVQDHDLQRALVALDRVVYNDAPNWDGTIFWNIFETGHKQREITKPKQRDPLPPLYPQR